MTKALTNQEKKEKKDARKQQKAASKTSKHVTQPKHEDPPKDANLCDFCAYEFGQCEGKPKFASDADPELKGAAADRVTACEGFLNVEQMPNADEQRKAAAEAGAAAEEPPPGKGPDAAHDGDGKVPPEAETEEEEEPKHTDELPYVPAPGPKLPDPKRFAQDETDYGACPSCNRPLKRTAYNRYVDAVRCTNSHCPQYRAIIKTLSSGVK